MKVSELFESEVKYAIGEKIQTKVGGKWIDATITKPMNKSGNYGVRFKVGTTTMNYVSAPEEIRKKVTEGVDKRPPSMIQFGAKTKKVRVAPVQKAESAVKKDPLNLKRAAELVEGTVLYGQPKPKHMFSIEIYDPKHNENRKIKVKANSKTEAEDYCEGKGYEVHKIEQLEEGWKMGAAAVALSGAVVAGIANSPKVEINGTTYDKATSLRSAPADAKTATVTIGGKKTKVLYWDAYGPKNNRKTKVYAEVE